MTCRATYSKIYKRSLHLNRDRNAVLKKVAEGMKQIILFNVKLVKCVIFCRIIWCINTESFCPLFLLQGDYDSGYLYHCKFSKKQNEDPDERQDEPFNFIPIHNADEDPICSISFR